MNADGADRAGSSNGVGSVLYSINSAGATSMPKKSVQQTAKNKADALFSLIVRSAGTCEKCGSASFLQTAHWLSRRYSNTRTDFDNAFCLCSACHRYFTADPTAWSIWAIDKRGLATYERLREAANRKSEIWWPDELVRLKVIAEKQFARD